MSMRGDDIGGFWSTGIWVGLRIFLVPSIVAVGFYAYHNPANAGLPDFKNPVNAQIERSLVQINSAMGGSSLLGGSKGRSIFTPNPGAKWVRP